MFDYLIYIVFEFKIIQGVKQDWELVIGFEVYVQVVLNVKLFFGVLIGFGVELNSYVVFVDVVMFGMLFVINEFCVVQVVCIGLGIKVVINLCLVFDCKNYFYFDLLQGYQISQFYYFIVGEGEVIVDMVFGVVCCVCIECIYLEQDVGKLIYDMDFNMFFVDLNCIGVVLMEIVSCFDICGFEEVVVYVVKLCQIMCYLGICDGNMQNGNLCVDVNVLVCLFGVYECYQEMQDFSYLGMCCEIKNMNLLCFI